MTTFTPRHLAGALFLATPLLAGCMGDIESLNQLETTNDASIATEEFGEAVAPLVTNGDTGEALEPIAEVLYEDGSGIRFYEADVGNLEVIEFGPNGTSPPTAVFDVAAALPVEIFEALAGEPAPAALVRAQEQWEVRVDEARLAKEYIEKRSSLGETVELTSEPNVTPHSAGFLGGDSAANGGDPNVGQTRQAMGLGFCQIPTSNWSEFERWYCYSCVAMDIDGKHLVGGADWEWLFYYVSGYMSRYKDDMNYTNGGVYMFQKAATFRTRHRVWYSWSTPIDKAVHQGNWVRTPLKSPYFDYDVHQEVFPNSGAIYSACGAAMGGGQLFCSGCPEY